MALLTITSSSPSWAVPPTHCANDLAYPIDTSGPTGASNCNFVGGRVASLTCDFPVAAASSGGTLSSPVNVKAVYVPGVAGPELHIFGTDGNGETFCGVQDMDFAGDWDLTLVGTGGNDGFEFEHNGHMLQSWDPFWTTVNVTVNAGGGDDQISLPHNNIAHAFTVNGEGGADTVIGSPLMDVMDGGPGNDALFGEGGPDAIFGNDGDDLIEGGDDNDSLDGGPGVDTVYGDAGNDIVCAGNAIGPADDLRGGDGDDQIWNGDSTGPGNADVRGEGNTTPVPGDACALLGGGIRVGCESILPTAPAVCS